MFLFFLLIWGFFTFDGNIVTILVFDGSPELGDVFMDAMDGCIYAFGIETSISHCFTFNYSCSSPASLQRLYPALRLSLVDSSRTRIVLLHPSTRRLRAMSGISVHRHISFRA